MKAWQRRAIGILTLGGSFLGMALGLQLLVSTGSALDKAFVVAFVGLYGYGVWLGVRLLEQAPRATRAASVFWLLQVPYFMSPLAGYLFTSGACLLLSFTVGEGAGFHWQLGSQFRYTLLQSGTPWIVGINVFALPVALYLAAVSRRALPAGADIPERVEPLDESGIDEEASA